MKKQQIQGITSKINCTWGESLVFLLDYINLEVVLRGDG